MRVESLVIGRLGIGEAPKVVGQRPVAGRPHGRERRRRVDVPAILGEVARHGDLEQLAVVEGQHGSS